MLNAVATYRPENNDLVLNEMERVVRRYPYVNCFVYDRACKILKDVAKRKKALWKIRTYSTDKFHGSRHKENCKANPFARAELMRRIQGLNTSVAEQTFSRFRGYARITNELKQPRHRFLVPLYAKSHNATISSGDTSHLNPYSHQKRKIAQTP